jgi:hypothetical protein
MVKKKNHNIMCYPFYRLSLVISDNSERSLWNHNVLIYFFLIIWFVLLIMSIFFKWVLFDLYICWYWLICVRFSFYVRILYVKIFYLRMLLYACLIPWMKICSNTICVDEFICILYKVWIQIFPIIVFL